MEIYLGRQPILDRKWITAAYELLFRSSQVNVSDAVNHIAATSEVIVNAVLGFGLDRLLGGRQAFINFDRTLLLGHWTAMLPPERVVIEIIDSVQPDQEVLSACRQLREQGYTLALDDCVDDDRTSAFAAVVDAMKVDFKVTPRQEREQLVRRYHTLKLRMIAKRVETEAEFLEASKLGYDFFQGYFFASPTVLQTTRVPASQMNVIRLMKEIQATEMDIDAVAEVVRHDISFSHALLTYLNSPSFHWQTRIQSVRQGLLLLGPNEIRKWICMAGLSSLAQNRPPVLLAQVLLRGRFCEAIARSARLFQSDSDPFLAGMFSLLGAILRRPLERILDEINIAKNIRNALLGIAGDAEPLSLILRIVKSYEIGDFSEVDAAARALGLLPASLSNCYVESLAWVETILSADGQTWGAGRAAESNFRRSCNEVRV